MYGFENNVNECAERASTTGGRVLIVGMGALGMLYGDIIQSSGKYESAFLMDSARFEKYKREELSVNGRRVNFNVVTPKTAASGYYADYMIFATKATSLDEAIELAAPFVGPQTVIVSVLNGISSEEILGRRFGNTNIVPCVAQGMDAVRNRRSLTYSSAGKLFIGPGAETSPDAYERLVCFFDRAGIPFEQTEDIMLRMWKKFMLNCGINQACMVYGGTYGSAVIPGTDIYDTFVGSMKEVKELAGCEGYCIEDADIDFYINLMASLNPQGMPSMAQDRINLRYSEVELFAGTVIRLAAKYGLEVPVNRRLYSEIKKIEAEY